MKIPSKDEIKEYQEREDRIYNFRQDHLFICKRSLEASNVREKNYRHFEDGFLAGFHKTRSNFEDTGSFEIDLNYMQVALNIYGKVENKEHALFFEQGFTKGFQCAKDIFKCSDI